MREARPARATLAPLATAAGTRALALRARAAPPGTRFQSSFDQVAVGIAHTALDGTLLDVNSKLCELLGYDAAELIGMTTVALTHPADRDDQVALRQELLDGKRRYCSGDKRYLRKDGSVLWATRTATLAQDKTGGAQYLIVTIENIDDRKHAEAELKRSLSLLQATLESTTDGILVVDNDGRVMSYNRRFLALWHIPDELAATQDDQHLLDYVLAQLTDPGRFMAKVQELYQHRDAMSHDVLDFIDGRTYERYSCPQTLDGSIIGRVWSFRDVTARRALERGFEVTFNHAAVGIVLSGLDGRYLLVNQKFADMLGYPRSALEGSPVADTVHPDDRNTLAPVRQKLMSGALDKYSRERRYVRKDGSIVWTNHALSLARDGQGRPQHLVGVIEDITERKAIEQRYQETFDQVGVGIVHTSIEGKYLRVNRKFCEMLGYTEDELLGRAAADLTLPEDRGHDAEARRLMWEGRLGKYREEKQYIHKDGHVVWANRTVSLARDSAGRPLYFIRVIEDITERKEADERYRSTFDSAPIGIMHTGIDSYRILHVNPKLCEMLGYTRDEMLRMASTALVHPEHRLTDAPLYHQQMLADRIRTFASERKFLRKDGSSLWVHRTVSLARDISGKPLYHIRMIEDITERKLAEETIARERALLRTIIDALPDLIYVKDRAGTFVLANKAWLAARGEPEQDIAGKTVHDYFPLEIAERMIAQDRRIVETGVPLLDVEQPMIVKNRDGGTGSVRWASTTKVPLCTTEGEIIGTAGISRDITEQKLSAARRAMEHTVTRVLAEAATLAEAMPRIIETICTATGWAYGARWVLDETEQRLCRAEYWCATEPDFDPSDRQYWLKVGDQGAGRLLRRAWVDKSPTWLTDLQDDHPFLRRASVIRLGWNSAYAFPIQIGNNVIGVMEFFGADKAQPDDTLLQITGSIGSQIGQFIQRKQAEDKLVFLARFDTVTDLPNRYLFCDRLGQLLTQAERNEWSVGVLFVDLDRFKIVNDTFGHAAGDELLRQVAVRMQACVRSGDTVGRLSGDEFSVMLSNLARADDAGVVAQKIVDALAAPFTLDGQQTYISASIGIALFPADGSDPDTLIKNADTAMYRAKEQGRNGYQFYLPQMNERLILRQQLEAQLRGALERREFLLHFQPKVSLANGAITGFEALLRWQHNNRLVSPADFIAILEETGLIVPVGEWVLHTTCMQIRQWEEAGLVPRPVAVNLSARQFQRNNLAEVVGRVLRETGIRPHLLKLELTESLLMSDARESIETLHRLKDLGVHLSVDDFGTGYSSLAYLKRFPLDELKIDRAFIRDAISDPDDAAIALTIINLAHSLNLKVVAEGVETEGQISFLRRHGCDEMQGFYFSKPVPVADCTQMLAADRHLPETPDNHSDCTRVLLVNSDEDTLQRLGSVLEPANFCVRTARNAAEAFESLARYGSDIVLTDNDAGNLNGIQFLTRIRKLYPQAVRVLAPNGGDAPTLTRATNNAGIHLFLHHDWEPDQLCAELRGTLQARSD